MQVNLKVKRFDPADSGGKTWWQEYKVDVHPDSTVLDALIQVREQEDGTLAMRCACRASICGSCGMKVKCRFEKLFPLAYRWFTQGTLADLS